MKRVILAGLAVVFVSGCSTVNHISPTEKVGTYYLITHKAGLFGASSKVWRCNSDTYTGDLKCNQVNVDF